jgi:hypothetical protein
MKTVFASIFALSMLAAPAAYAAHVGVNVGGLGVGLHVGGGHHHRHCVRWSHHHHGVCRQWGW